MTFVGLAGLRDPPRPEVRAAMEECRLAVRPPPFSFYNTL